MKDEVDFKKLAMRIATDQANSKIFVKEDGVQDISEVKKGRKRVK